MNTVNIVKHRVQVCRDVLTVLRKLDFISDLCPALGQARPQHSPHVLASTTLVLPLKHFR